MSIRSVAALLCAVVLTLCLCACGPQGAGSSSQAPSAQTSSLVMVDVAEYAAKGEIYGCEFALGTLPDAIKTAYGYQDPGETVSQEGELAESTEQTTYEGELMIYDGDPVRMVTGAAKYYYRAALADQGVAYIAFFDDPFSYYIGLTSKNDILRTVDGEPIYNDTADPADMFFYYGVPENVWEIQYRFGNYVLTFFLENDCLAVTTIYFENTWTDQAAE